MFEWDETKSLECSGRRGFSFDIVHEFDWETAVIAEDTRQDYGERRFRAFGMVDGAYFCVAFTPRAGRLRIISVRRMHGKEAKRYGL
ncbi:BrnT family toxin [Eilatimonas milleporae]|uniref:Uncharacterized protein n=1 Tax=Eilatimonas milleporae TaxID=911205 RepID=A0A3M0CR39_9PROT|nr:BrnT family toxin [Eilatimonas milleporae]RMB11948.1 hypothetical protein BXY39_0436 [Eilatimonas milleporae]